MNERYEKTGVSVRIDASARGASTIILREGGWSRSSRSEFSCGPLPLPQTVLRQPQAETLTMVDESVRRMAKGRAVVERLTLVEGHAQHLLVAGTKRSSWIESAARLFLTLVRQPCGRRASLSLGAGSLSQIDLAAVQALSRALSFPEGGVNHQQPALRFEPWVGASLVRVLASDRVELQTRLRIVQRPPAGAFDGRGRKIRRRVVRRSRSPWPDCFRPSYRFAPSFVPLHVDLIGTEPKEIETPLTVVSLASEWVREGDVRLARVWVEDRSTERISFCELAVDVRAMSRHTVHSAGEATWFPEGAGAWGRRLILEAPAVLLRSP